MSDAREPQFLGYYLGYYLVSLDGVAYAIPFGGGELLEEEIREQAAFVCDTEAELRRTIAASCREYEDELNLPEYYNTFFTDTFPSAMPLPDVLEIEPFSGCNLRCVMCHVTHVDTKAHVLDVDKLLAWLEPSREGLAGRWVVVGASYEPTLNRDLPKLLRGLTDLGCNISFLTNGSLLDDTLIEALAQSNIRQLIISFDGISQETYEKVRVRGKHADTLQRINKLKQALKGKNTYSICNFVAMRSTVAEIPEALEYWDSAGFNALNVINYRGFSEFDDGGEGEFSNEELEEAIGDAIERIVAQKRRICLVSNSIPQWAKEKYPKHAADGNAFSFAHPQSAPPIFLQPRFQLGENPDLPVECRSPDRWMRVYADGQCLVCHDRTIGSIDDGSVSGTWTGTALSKWREKIQTNDTICLDCGHYRFCLRGGDFSGYSQSDQVYSHVVPAVLYRTDEYQVIKTSNRFYGVPFLVGAVDTVAMYRGDEQHDLVLEADSLEGLEALIRKYPRALDRIEGVKLMEEYKGFHIYAAEGRLWATQKDIEPQSLLDRQQRREMLDTLLVAYDLTSILAGIDSLFTFQNATPEGWKPRQPNSKIHNFLFKALPTFILEREHELASRYWRHYSDVSTAPPFGFMQKYGVFGARFHYLRMGRSDKRGFTKLPRSMVGVPK